jgi:mRNA interferase MazF
MGARLISRSEICLATFPFGDRPGMKLRPVLVLAPPTGPGPEVLVAYISSIVPTELLPTDLVIDPSRPEFRATGLKVVSVLRLHKLGTIHVRTVVRSLGSIEAHHRMNVAAKLLRHLDLEKE